jgi:hypothetical protein
VLNPAINAVLEVFTDSVEGLDDSTLGDGPFRGVPLFLKDLDSGEIGRPQECGAPPARVAHPDIMWNPALLEPHSVIGPQRVVAAIRKVMEE